MNISKKTINVDLRLFLIISTIIFVIFLFTSNAHRYSIDEDIAQQQTIHLITQQPDPNYVQGKSKMEFNYPSIAPWVQGPPCQNGILCYPAYIGHSITEIPLVFINHEFHIMTQDTVIWTSHDFDDPHYVYWRNSLDPDFTFLQLFYGPFFSALSMGIFFLICRSFDFSQKNSVILTFLCGVTTTVWAYSNTSLNGVPMMFFVLLGYLFFRKFQKNQFAINLLICGTSFGFGFLTRPDTVLFIVPVFFCLIYELIKQNARIKKFFAYVIPILFSYILTKIIDFLRFGTPVSSGIGNTASNVATLGSTPFSSTIPEGVFGMLLSPGVGLLIFAPILLTLFFSFPDFYKRNRRECVLFLSFTIFFLIEYGPNPEWHGLIAWGARYLLPIVPFLLLPLGASLETRKNSLFKILLPILGGIGVLFNVVYVIQDVSWFVWTFPGSHTGLYGLATPSTPLYLSPATIWTFQYSQLTQSIVTAFTHLQPDIFLLKLFGPIVYGVIFSGVVIFLSYLFLNVIKEKHKIFLSS